MTLEYHKRVQRSISASPALLGMLLLPLLLVSSSSAAQLSSSTSSASAHAGGAAPPSASSFAHNGYVPSTPGVTHVGGGQHITSGPHNTAEHHRQPSRSADGIPYYPYLYAVPVPYAAEDNDADTSEEDDAEYQGGPTVFDRRGSGATSYVPPDYEGPAHAGPAYTSQDQQSAVLPTAGASESATDPPQRPTTLVFKDGHQLTVENYAIVGQTLYDLTAGHPRKIALSDLDLPATAKQNDNHGIDFQLPTPGQGN
ncbi:MAG: hypothetical protein WB660_08520 [Candidatus Sulfotelmatobacter sp.]